MNKTYPIINGIEIKTRLPFYSTLGDAITVDGFVKCKNTGESIVQAIIAANALGWKLSGKLVTKLRTCVEVAQLMDKENLYASPNKPSVHPSANPVKKHNSASKKREFELHVAEKYVAKYKNAQNRGIEFDLSLTDMKRLMKITSCFYTGVDLTFDKPSNDIPPNLWTLERINDKKGYIKSNVVVCSYASNMWKSQVVENPTGAGKDLSIQQMIALLTKVESHSNV
jgi:hypothetical protein